jgi:hypothetical protein
MKTPNLFGVDGEPKLNGGGDALEATVSSKITFVGSLSDYFSVYSDLLFVDWQNCDPSCFALSTIILMLIYRLRTERCVHVCYDVTD